MKKYARWVPALFWMGVIFYLSGRTGSELRGLFPFIENFNLGHFLAYFVLSGLFHYALAHLTSPGKTSAVSILLCFLYSLTDEYHQAFVPTRSPEMTDIINDLAGAVTAAAIFQIYKKKR